MNRYVLCAALVLAASPLQAQSSIRSAAREARPVVADTAVAIPRGERPTQTDRQAAAEHLRHIYARAQNAVENGASPERVRSGVQQYKEQLLNRWNSTHGN